MARTASVYGLFPEELLPESSSINEISVLVHEASREVLKGLSASTGCSVKTLSKRTVADGPAWPLSWRIAHDIPLLPPLQICPQCIADDLNSNSVQFLRLRWQCAAVTICHKHLAPLQPACIHCRQPGWPVCMRGSPHRFRFFCRRCGNLQERENMFFERDIAAALQVLSRFESQLLRALASRPIEWCWVGYTTPKEFLLLVEDLLWAMTRQSYRSRPIYKLQTPHFPLKSSYLPPSIHDWRFALPHVRRCLLASVLSIFGNSKARAVLQGRGTYALRWYELLGCLAAEYVAELERRSRYWPPAAHNAFRRAAQIPREKRFFHSMGGRLVY